MTEISCIPTDDLTAKVKSLEKEIRFLKQKLNKVHAEKNYYKKRYNAFKNEFDKLVNEKLNNSIDKILHKVNHEHEMEVMKLKQQIFSLNNKLNTNSKNSSLPCSKNPITSNLNTINKTKIYNSRKKSNKKIGGQYNHQKHELKPFDDNEVDEFINYTHEQCPYCNSNNIELTTVKQRDELDTSIKVIKKRHNFYEYKCLDCGKIIKTKIPLNLHANNQYGGNVKALALMLTNVGFVSINRTKSMISCITNNEINMSEGYIAKLSKKVVGKTDDFLNEIKTRLINSNILYWDDTNVVIGKNKHGCLRTYLDTKNVFYAIHYSKSVKGVEADGILERLTFNNYLMHDHYSHNYNKKYKFKNLECNAHITRALEGITQASFHSWSRDMKELLEVYHAKRKEKLDNNIDCFCEQEILEFDEKYDHLLEIGQAEYEKLTKTNKFDKEKNMLKFMRKYKEQITAWIRDFELPYSNNPSESSFRFIKSKQKISGQFKSLTTAQDFAKIMSYVETCSRYEANKFEAIKRLVENEPYTFEELDRLKPAI